MTKIITYMIANVILIAVFTYLLLVAYAIGGP